MAALDFPDAPTVGQVFQKWFWNGSMWALSPGGMSGYTFVQDTTPTSTKVGDTWFDTSTGATGGTSWVAIEEGAVGSEKVWVQTSPGAGAPPAGPIYRRFTATGTSVPTAGVGVIPFSDAVGDAAGPVGNPSSGVFTLGQKGLYMVSHLGGWSTSFGSPGVLVELYDSAAATYGGNPVWSPWAGTEATWLLDHPTSGLNRNYGIRIYNYTAATMVVNSQVVVTRVSDRT